MRHARTIAPIIGLLVVVGFVSPAGARARAATNQDIFSAGLLTSADVPAGWTPSKQADSGGQAYRSVKGCKLLAANIEALRHAAPHKLSPTFTDNGSPHQLTSAANAVYAFKNSGAASKLLVGFRIPGATACLENVAKKGGGKGTTATASQITSGPAAADGFVGYSVTLQGRDQSGATVTGVLDIEVVRVGRSLVAFSFANEGTPLSQAPGIVDTVVSRLKAANA
jgi:hypothetical protein